MLVFFQNYIICAKSFFVCVVCVWREKVSEEKDRIILFIILLGSLYYFIGLYVKIKTGMLDKL